MRISDWSSDVCSSDLNSCYGKTLFQIRHNQMTSEWDGIEEFLAVYDRGRFAPAAKSLRKSPSHVRRAISRLEARLGERLFQLTTRIVTPTELAHAFADRCLHSVADRLEALALCGGQGPPRG